MDELWRWMNFLALPISLAWGTLLLWKRWSPRTVNWLPLRMIHVGVMFDVVLGTQAYLETLQDVRGRWADNPMNMDASWGELGIALFFIHWLSLFVALGVTLILGLQRMGKKAVSPPSGTM
jgi:hypothetical protein